MENKKDKSSSLVFRSERQSEMAVFSFVIEGKVGTLINVLTYPEHQNKDYGKFLMESFIELGGKFNLSFIYNFHSCCFEK